MTERRWARLVTGFTVAAMLGAATPALPAVANGRRAPDFSARDLDGTPVRLSDFAEKQPVYLWFWASW